MNFQKNQIVMVEIVDINSDGEGIGKVDGFPLFIKDAVIGDYAEVKITKLKKNLGYGRLMRLITPSQRRIEPLCPVARQCGGCQLQCYNYEEQLIFKQNKIKNNLERIGKITGYTMHAMIGMEDPYHYRNKAQFPVGYNKEGKIITGFYAGRTHSIIEQEECALGMNVWQDKGMDINRDILRIIREFMKENDISAYDEITHKGLMRHVLIRQGHRTKEVLVCLVINGRKLKSSEKLIEKLKYLPGMVSITLNINTERTNVILGKELILLWGKEYLTDYLGDFSFHISPLSFYQVNPIQTERLYQKALDYAALSGEEIVWDLYCGIGTISLFLAKKAKKVYGVEIIPQAIENAKENARRNHIQNVEFFVGRAEDVLPKWYQKNQKKADVIVVDPPRKGCDEALLSTIVKMNPKKVIYVSCDSATLARDLRYLVDNGYKVKDVQGVDLFPQTTHCEVCAKLCLK